MDGFTVVRCGACARMPSGFDDGAAALPRVDEVLVEDLRTVVRESLPVRLRSPRRLTPGRG